MTYTPPSSLRRRRLARPKDRITDNREAFAATMRHRNNTAQAIPADYDLGQSKLEEYHAFRRVCAFIALAGLTLTACLVLAKLFTPGA
jgi:hypothetical protein